LGVRKGCTPLDCNIDFNGIAGLTIAKVHIALEDYLSELSVPASLDFMETEDGTGVHPSPHEDRPYDIRTEMQNEIQLVENISCPSCSNIDTDAAEVRRLLDVSRVDCSNLVRGGLILSCRCQG
jgi:hypothetical protein